MNPRMDNTCRRWLCLAWGLALWHGGASAVAGAERVLTSQMLREMTGGVGWSKTVLASARFDLSGHALYVIDDGPGDNSLWRVNLDQNTAQRLFPQGQRDGSELYRLFELCVAPTGDLLAFVAAVARPSIDLKTVTLRLVLLTLTTGQSTDVAVRLKMVPHPLQFTPNGTHLLVDSGAMSKEERWTRLTLATGQSQALPWTHFGIWNPAGTAVARLRWVPEEGASKVRLLVQRFDLEEPIVLYQGSLLGAPVWAPDGKTVAVAQKRRDGGEETILVNVTTKASMIVTRGVPRDWSRDGRKLLVVEFLGGPDDPTAPWAHVATHLKIVEGFTRP